MAKLTSSKSGNKARSAVRGKTSGRTSASAARIPNSSGRSDGAGKAVAVAPAVQPWAQMRAPPVETAIDADVREVLKSIYASLKDVLEQMAGKVEFGLKVTWDRDRIIEELKRDDEEIHRFHQELTKKHLQSTYFARMQLGRMIDKAMVERSAEFVREIYDGLRSVCVASRDNKPIGDRMIMNAAFLIQRERETDFDAAVNKIAKKFGDRLNFKYTGPWPPYNFVNIRLKLERGTSS